MNRQSHYFEALEPVLLTPEEQDAEAMAHDFARRGFAQVSRRRYLANALLQVARYHRYQWVFALSPDHPRFAAIRQRYRATPQELVDRSELIKSRVTELAGLACGVCVFAPTCVMAGEGLVTVLFDRTKVDGRSRSRGAYQRARLQHAIESSADPAACPSVIVPSIPAPRHGK